MNISFENIINYFRSKKPDLEVISVVDLNDDWYVIEAIKGDDNMDPHYAVNKHTKEITNYILSMDLDNYFDAIDAGRVFYLKKR